MCVVRQTGAGISHLEIRRALGLAIAQLNPKMKSIGPTLNLTVVEVEVGGVDIGRGSGIVSG